MPPRPSGNRSIALTGLILFVVGLGLLVLGGEILVRGATMLARLAGLPPAVIGLTVVAAGTSLPELTVSLLAAWRGEPDIAVGNVIGSNIFNVTMALGLAAIVCPLPVRSLAIRLEWPFMFGAAAVCAVFLRDSRLDRAEAGFLVLALVLFMAYSVRIARKEITGEEKQAFEDEAKERSLKPARREGLYAMALLVTGIALLVVGGYWLVDGAVRIARMFGMSERVIGLTVVAVGTGMPEVVTSIIAGLRKQTEVAVANMIGSNIINLLGILGISAMIHPIKFAASLGTTDLWWMLGTSLLLLPILWTGRIISRIEGVVLVGVYATYTAFLL